MKFTGKTVTLAHDRAPNLVRKTFTVEADTATMERFEKFLAYVQWCCGVGHSTHVAMSADGDGADSFHVKEDLPKFKESDVASENSGQFEWVK